VTKCTTEYFKHKIAKIKRVSSKLSMMLKWITYAKNITRSNTSL